MKRVGLLIGRIAYWVGWPGVHLFLHGSHRTRLLVRRGDRCLIVQGYLGGYWTLPGGGIGRTELANVAAARELREEVGLEVEPTAFEHIITTDMSLHGHQYHAVVYGCSVSPTTEVTTRSYEIAAVRWVPLEEALAVLSDPRVRTSIRRWVE